MFVFSDENCESMNCAIRRKSKELDQKSDKVIRFKLHHRQGFNSDYETLRFNLIADIYRLM
jgi:hypothetical protein